MDFVELPVLPGNVGGFVGAIAVPATLIFLPLQTRHARTVSHGALQQRRSDAVRGLSLTIVRDGGSAEAASGKTFTRLRRSKPPAQNTPEDTGLGHSEAPRLERWMAASFFHRQTVFRANLNRDERRTLDERLPNVYREDIPCP